MESAPKGYALLSWLGLIVGLWGALLQPRVSSTPPEVDPARLVYPATVAGIPVASQEEFRFLVQSRPPGSTVRIESSDRTGATATRTVRLVRQMGAAQLFMVFLTGILFFAVNLLVFRPRARDDATRDFYWATLLFGTAVLIGGVYLPRAAPRWTDLALSIIWIVCLALLPVIFLHLTAVFPRRCGMLLIRARWLLPSLWIAAGLLVLWQSIGFLRYAAAPGPAGWAAFSAARLAARVTLIAQVAASIVALYLGSRRLPLTSERQQARWLLWGFTVGVAPYVFLRTLLAVFGLQSPVNPTFDRVFELAIPIAFTFSVVRYRFLDIDIIIRRSLIYSILAGVLVSVYFLLAYLLAASFRLSTSSGLVPAVSAAVAVALFPVTRRMLGRWVDRTFFKLGYDYDRELERFRGQLAGAATAGEVVSQLRELAQRVLGTESAVVRLRTRRGCFAEGSTEDPEQLRARAERFGSLLRRSGSPVLGAPLATSLPEIESDAFLAEAPGTCLAVGFALAEESSGVLLLGARRSGHRYIETDVRFCESAASLAGSACERIDLVQRATEAADERERLDEINRLKNDFYSRAAHDLRTPLTSISWSTHNLLDGVAGPLDPRQAEYVEEIGAAAEQLERLVANLTEITRLEDGRMELDSSRVELDAVVAQAARSLRPVARQRSVGITTVSPAAAQTHGGPAPCVRGDRARLTQVVVNLLDNAIGFSPDGAAVEIAWTCETCSEQGRRVRLTVRDHGAGIEPDEIPFLFDRYHQGRPSPYVGRRGMGLGLHVVRSIVQQMGGSVEAANHPDGGAVFTCLLPVWVDGWPANGKGG